MTGSCNTISTLNEKQTHKMALHQHLRIARRSEQFETMLGHLLDELIDAAIAAIETKLAQAQPEVSAPKPKQQPKRTRNRRNCPVP